MAEIFADNITTAPSFGRQCRRLLGFFVASIAAERDRWGLWIPVGLGIGIGGYFGLTVEPPLWCGTTAAILFSGFFWLGRRAQRATLIWMHAACLPAAIIAVGFALAQFQNWRVTAPIIDHELGIVQISGHVVDIELQTTGIRVTLAPTAIERLQGLPRFVRLKLRHPVDGLDVGDDISLRAALMPPPGPALPGGFDFQRQAWFAGLGGVGYGVGAVIVTPAQPSGLGNFVKTLRVAMTDRIRSALPPETGGIAAALITGERGAVPTGVNQDYRDSGLSHLLVIAGLHMTLVTGFVFFAVRGVLALIPGIALRYPIKKWAAAAALSIALLYLIISGAAIPTERAFVMVGLGFLAILVDRAHVSMLAVAWAAGVVLVMSPAALTGVSFQMSFAAVIGLVAFYETFGQRLSALRRDAGPVGRALLFLSGIALTTIVATMGTAAFSIYHFDRFAVFSVLANVLAVPVAAFWVMPWALFACLLMPFHGEAIGLVPMGCGIALIEQIAHMTAALPGAVLNLPAMPNWGLLLVSIGGLWLAIWRLPWRWWGCLPILLGLLSILTVRPPDLIASEDGRLVALKIADRYVLSSTRLDNSQADAWLRAAGGAVSAAMPVPGAADGPLRCDRLGCIWQSPAGLVAIDHDPAAIAEDCRAAAILITAQPPSLACRRTKIVLDRADLWRNGATALWLDGTIQIATANASRGDRPWVIKPRTNFRKAADQ